MESRDEEDAHMGIQPTADHEPSNALGSVWQLVWKRTRHYFWNFPIKNMSSVR